MTSAAIDNAVNEAYAPYLHQLEAAIRVDQVQQAKLTAMLTRLHGDAITILDYEDLSFLFSAGAT